MKAERDGRREGAGKEKWTKKGRNSQSTNNLSNAQPHILPLILNIKERVTRRRKH